MSQAKADIMSHFRFRFQQRGGHTHMRVFAAKSSALTHGKCGDLCMTNTEFDDFRTLLESSELGRDRRKEIEFEKEDEYPSEQGQFGVGA